MFPYGLPSTSCLPGQTGGDASVVIRLQHGWDHFPFGIQDLTLFRRHQSDHN